MTIVDILQEAALGGTPAAFKARIDGEMKRWTPVIQAGNIKIN